LKFTIRIEYEFYTGKPNSIPETAPKYIAKRKLLCIFFGFGNLAIVLLASIPTQNTA